MPDLTFLSAVSMAELIRQKKLSAIELVQAHLSKITRLNPKLNAYVHVNSDAALQQARVDEQSLTQNQILGPLHGVPLSIKSSIDVGGGFRCESGTKLRAGHVPSPDAPLVSRLRKAGAIILGVTNTPELLMAWETDNLLYGRTNNPWDLLRTPGGSSGGEASAIASGCSAGGVGSDGGGSIRVPAHFSGICGLKPTPGRIPATGHYPISVGPFALLGVVGPMTKGREADLSPILKEFLSWVAAEPSHTAQTLLDTWIQRDLVRMQVFQQMRDYPILLSPVASIPAFRHGERSWKIDGQTVRYLDAWSYTEWFNLLGTPAAVVPVAQSAEGLPIGVQISGLPWEEEMVLAVAAALEAERGERRQPPIA